MIHPAVPRIFSGKEPGLSRFAAGRRRHPSLDVSPRTRLRSGFVSAGRSPALPTAEGLPLVDGSALPKNLSREQGVPWREIQQVAKRLDPDREVTCSGQVITNNPG